MTKALGIAKWFALLVPHLLLVFVANRLAPYAVRKFSTDDKLHIRSPFRWMETIDNDLTGDKYWQDSLGGDDPLSDAARIGWLKRNGGNAVNYGLLGVPSDQAWLDQYRSPINGLITGGPVWWHGSNWCLKRKILGFDLVAGWNLIGPHNGRAKYWLSLRKHKDDPSIPEWMK